MKFSVIVANYENSRFLPDLVRGMLSQTYADWELVIVDDRSQDDPAPYLEPFLPDPRIRLIRHDVNRGAASAFRTAAGAATGELIGMLGADDALLPDALEKMARAHAGNPSASLVTSTCYACDEDLRITGVYKHYRPIPPGGTLIREMCIGNFATFKREAYLRTAGFDPAFRRALDHDIFLKLDEVGEIVCVDEPLYLYRSNPIGISQGENGSRAAQYSLLARYRAYCRRLGTSKDNLTRGEAVAIRQNWFIREIHFHHRAGDRPAARRLCREAMLEVPSILARRDFLSNLLRAII